MKKPIKKLVLMKETVHYLGLQNVKGGAAGSYSELMRYCDSWWHCGASADTFC